MAEESTPWWQSALQMVGGGLAGAIGSVINWIGGRDEQKRAQDANVSQWEREAAYNSPVEQVKRLEAANLNPALAYGGSNSMGPMARVEPIRPNVQIGDLGQIAQVRNLDAQNASIVAATKINNTQAELQARQLRQQKWIEKHTGYPAALGDPLPIGIINRAVAAADSARQAIPSAGDADQKLPQIRKWVQEDLKPMNETVKNYDPDKYRRKYYEKHGGQ